MLVPDNLFFVRTVPIGDATSAEAVASQVELGLEALAPFPLAQLYYGHYWPKGSATAVVFAAYRKRFPAEQADSWYEAEMVLPVFATLLTAQVEPATTVLLKTDEGVTAIHWGDAAVPSTVATRNWTSDTPAGERLRIRDELVHALGGSRNVIDLDTAPEVESDGQGGDYVFRSGPVTAPFSREQLDSLDVRDKTDLLARRRARLRDLYLWRGFVTCAVGVALAALLELGVMGGKVWQHSRQRVVDKQAPVVSDIMRAQTLSERIDELSTNRLRPIEMIQTVGTHRPPALFFVSTTTRGLHDLEIRAQTTSPADVAAFQASLRQVPEILKMDAVQELHTSGEGVSDFRLVVTFKPDAFKTPHP